MTRAQAATVMDRLITAKGGSTTVTPPEEQQPPEGAEKLFVTPDMLLGGLAEGQSFNDGVFTLNYTDNGTINAAPTGLQLRNTGYSKITLTVKSNFEGDLSILVGCIDNPYKADVRYATYNKGDHMKFGDVRTITADISNAKTVAITIGSQSVNAEVPNIYLHN